jgi:ribonuclease HII
MAVSEAPKRQPKKPRYVRGAVGLDEAGCGPLAGPVVAAAIHVPERFDLTGIDDSKRLTPAQREELEVRLLALPHAIVAVEAETIDRVNILQARLLAMRLAFEKFEAAWSGRPIVKVLIDGNRVPLGLETRGFAIVGGDARFACIAAASILAKTSRDRTMRALAERYPEYGFDRHFGYPTPEHRQALERFGPCPAHRRSFEPVARLLEPQPLLLHA